jgi:hypothetical protein
MLRRLSIVQSMGCLRAMVVARSGDAEVFTSSGCFDEGADGRQADTVKRIRMCISCALSGLVCSTYLLGC